MRSLLYTLVLALFVLPVLAQPSPSFIDAYVSAAADRGQEVTAEDVATFAEDGALDDAIAWSIYAGSLRGDDVDVADRVVLAGLLNAWSTRNAVPLYTLSDAERLERANQLFRRVFLTHCGDAGDQEACYRALVSERRATLDAEGHLPQPLLDAVRDQAPSR